MFVVNQEHCFDRVGAPPHAAVRGGVPAVCLPLDEQPFDEGAAAALHNQTVGHLPGTETRTHTQRARTPRLIKRKKLRCSATSSCCDLKKKKGDVMISQFPNPYWKNYI